MNYHFRLKVTEIYQKDCQFELSWGKGQQIIEMIEYPQSLRQSYQTWQRAYQRYYQSGCRGSVITNGSFSPMNPKAQLEESQKNLLTEFNTWIRNGSLIKIRVAIATEIGNLAKQNSTSQINIFITCSSLELEKLPWEAWELAKEIAASIPIRLIRTPINISSSDAISRKIENHCKARVLAIFGDQTGLDFKTEIDTLDAQASSLEVKFMTWQDQSINQFIKEVCQAISDPQGWDILFFAGHSRDTATTGGELAIAPNTTISISEITFYLKKAQENGLQFAFFNSCSGLSIAKSLIDLGINQVVIMREQIENKVAQEFMVKFLQVLAQYKDVYEALEETCQSLKINTEYPSAYLIPSLFCHPNAKLFKIEPPKARWKQWLPNRQQAIALSSLIFISLLSPIQTSLLNTRTFIQAIYRDVTAQVPDNSTPPVLLVSIDKQSLREANITEFNPLNRKYLAKLIDKLSSLNAKVIGIDYLLDYPQKQNDLILAQSIRNAISKQETSFVFAVALDTEQKNSILPKIASPNWSLQGSLHAYYYYLAEPLNCAEICPLAYLLAVTQTLSYNHLTHPKLESQTPYNIEVLNSLESASSDQTQLNFLKNVRLNPITQASQYFGQKWLQPINDFSLPPEIVYQTVSASQLLETETLIDQQVVLIASGGYDEAGIDEDKDYIDLPFAIAFWDAKNSELPYKSRFTGGEAHAYMLHHWLNQYIIIPIPDLWMILLAAILGQAILLKLVTTYDHQKKIFFSFLIIHILYTLISLQVYISLRILIPWLLPSLTFWIYLLPKLRKLSYEK